MDSKKLNNRFREKKWTRFKIWNYFNQRGRVKFPLPCTYRFPSFEGSFKAATRLARLEEFKKASHIFVGYDHPQKQVRYQCLQRRKFLYVPVPRRSLCHSDKLTFVHQVRLPPIHRKGIIQEASILNGAEKFGTGVSVKEAVIPFVEIVVVGSVAVDLAGNRIGKGSGIVDLQIGIMRHIGMIDGNSLIVTTVHEDQIFEELPAHFFMEYDVPVDIIITPRRVIRVSPRRPKPTGLLWKHIPPSSLKSILLLKTLWDKDLENGKQCLLKGQNPPEPGGKSKETSEESPQEKVSRLEILQSVALLVDRVSANVENILSNCDTSNESSTSGLEINIALDEKRSTNLQEVFKDSSDHSSIQFSSGEKQDPSTVLPVAEFQSLSLKEEGSEWDLLKSAYCFSNSESILASTQNADNCETNENEKEKACRSKSTDSEDDFELVKIGHLTSSSSGNEDSSDESNGFVIVKHV